MYGTNTVGQFTAPMTAGGSIRIVIRSLTGALTITVSTWDGNGNEVPFRRAPVDYTARHEPDLDDRIRSFGRTRWPRSTGRDANTCRAIASSRRPPPVDLELRLVDGPPPRDIAASVKPPTLARRRRPCAGRYCSVQA